MVNVVIYLDFQKIHSNFWINDKKLSKNYMTYYITTNNTWLCESSEINVGKE